MTRYLVRSSFLHAAAFAFFFLLLSRGAPKKTYYTINFLAGAPAQTTAASTAGPTTAPAAAAAAKTPMEKAPVTKAPAKARGPQPLPSLKRWLAPAKAATLKDAEIAERSRKKNAPVLTEAQPAMSPSRAASAQTGGSPTAAPAASGSSQTSAPPSAATGQAGTQIGTDLSDFPYPWYLERLRTALWNQWSQRMPGGSFGCVVTFTVARDGSVSDISVSDSTGGHDLDYAATSSVQAAAPFPPLPQGFSDPTLRVHVDFQSQ